MAASYCYATVHLYCVYTVHVCLCTLAARRIYIYLSFCRACERAHVFILASLLCVAALTVNLILLFFLMQFQRNITYLCEVTNDGSACARIALNDDLVCGARTFGKELPQYIRYRVRHAFWFMSCVWQKKKFKLWFTHACMHTYIYLSPQIGE